MGTCYIKLDLLNPSCGDAFELTPCTLGWVANWDRTSTPNQKVPCSNVTNELCRVSGPNIVTRLSVTFGSTKIIRHENNGRVSLPRCWKPKVGLWPVKYLIKKKTKFQWNLHQNKTFHRISRNYLHFWKLIYGDRLK